MMKFSLPSAGKAGWEMRFEKFNVQWEKEGFLSMDELKSFIASELAREREEIAKELERMKVAWTSVRDEPARDAHFEGYNQALTEAAKKVRKE